MNDDKETTLTIPAFLTAENAEAFVEKVLIPSLVTTTLKVQIAELPERVRCELLELLGRLFAECHISWAGSPHYPHVVAAPPSMYYRGEQQHGPGDDH